MPAAPPRIAYGIARSHVLGIEVVLADGRILNNLNKLKKGQYRLRPEKPFHRRRRHARHHHRGGAAAGAAAALGRDRLCRLPSPEAALELLGIAHRSAGGGVTSFEIMTRRGIELVVLRTAGCRDPLRRRIPGTC
jgi:hypothetical protein